MYKQKIVMKKVLTLFVVCFIQITGIVIIAGTIPVPMPEKSDYPHWNFNDKKTYNKLVNINAFIESNKNKNLLAVFDWDGTLYNENIPVKEMGNKEYAGQPAYYFWAAKHKDSFKFPVFPMFETKDGKFLDNVIVENDYLENKTNIHPDDYSKFAETSIFSANMTPDQFSTTVERFLAAYKAEQYVFLPMLDVLQRMIDSGFNVWIITGSNQYFVAVALNYIENNIEYKKNRNYKFNLGSVPYKSQSGHIAGNALKLMDNGKFSVVYDNRYVKNTEGKLYIVNGYGKEIAVKKLEKKYNTRAVFAAGNSGGDYYDIKYVAEKPGTLAIAVEPRGELPELVKEFPGKVIELTSSEI